MLLSHVNSPEDLKFIGREHLPRVCEGIREIIIDAVSKNGGHLAPSLGTVELTVAMHYVFDSPSDKIVWDVGHQSYAHKIITGRRDKFHTLRKEGGISGFPKTNESPHDTFNTGHSSTSISAAVGIAKAMKRKGLDNRAIAVIGDGSMTGGMAFEALNQAGHKVGNLVVVLNDNEMSISPNVGALSKFLSKRIHGKRGSSIRQHIKKLLLLIPFWGKRLYYVSKRAQEAAVGFFTPGLLFEAFGFDYIGPLDGYNLDELVEVFREIKSRPVGDSPVLVHVLTKKGKGYKPAEDDPTRFHGTGPFDKATGKAASSSAISYTMAFADSLVRLAKKNESIVAITAAMPTGTGLDAFMKEFPDRTYDVGIAEGHAVTFAAGLASQGLRPVVAIYSSFLQRAVDSIVHDVCLQNLPVVFAIDRAGLVGDDGPTHHGTFDLTYLRMIPNLTVLAPRSAQTLDKMLEFATKHSGPVAIRYPRGPVPEEVYESGYEFEPAKAETLFKPEGAKAAILAVGHLVPEAIAAAKKLADEGIPCEVIDPCSIKPLDVRALERISSSYGLIVTVEENVIAGGFSSAVNGWLSSEGKRDVRLIQLGLPDRFVEHAEQARLRNIYGIDSEAIAKAVRDNSDALRDAEGVAAYSKTDKITAI
jgi:1-deoxy-D-xylulose-5-phosphate synthase